MLRDNRLLRMLPWLAATALFGAGCDLQPHLGLQQPAADATRRIVERPAADAPADDADNAGAGQDGGGADDAGPQEPAGGEPAAQPAGDGKYGAGRTGPAAESCATDGTRVSSASQIDGGGTFLLEGGTYGSLRVPSGATVKPFDCEKVAIRGTVSLGNGATLAGVTVTSDAGWVVNIGGRNITLRHNAISGGSTETVRIRDNATDVRLEGNTLDGGRNNHVVKVKSESSGRHPADIVIHNNRFTKMHYSSSSEDLLQLEGHRNVTITNNTFSNNPRGEDGVDVKQGTQGMVMRRNHFIGGNINSECLLVQGGYARNIVENNHFEDCNAISLGAHPEARLDPWWRFAGNLVENSELRLRRSENAEVVNNVMVGGVLKLGIAGGDDVPRNPTISGNKLTDVSIANRVAGDLTCADNAMSRVSGDRLRCS